MPFLTRLIDFVFHVDKNLELLIGAFGPWTYVILFAVIFLETGLVVVPFLPGDSLLFAAGAFAARGSLSLSLLLVLLFCAAVIGDAVNYFAGKYIGEKAARAHRFIKQEHLERTTNFFEKHGKKAIIIARFIPIIRTFAPFVAGVARMRWRDFFYYNIVGGATWVFLFLCAGYWFGNIPVVRERFSLVIIGIVIVSFLPVVIEWIKHKKKK